MRFCWILVASWFLLALGVVEEGPETIRFETAVGPATLDHRGHQRRVGNNCSVCHHQAEEGKKKACGKCHSGRVEASGQEGTPSYFDVKTKLCRGCHLEKRETERTSTAPIHCRECHDIRAKAQEREPGL